MRTDGGLDDNQVDRLVNKGVIKEVDGVILKKMDGPAQEAYLQALVDEANDRKDHPWL